MESGNIYEICMESGNIYERKMKIEKDIMNKRTMGERKKREANKEAEKGTKSKCILLG